MGGTILTDLHKKNVQVFCVENNKLFFFEEYTEHGIEHIEMALKVAEFLIPDESFQ